MNHGLNTPAIASTPAVDEAVEQQAVQRRGRGRPRGSRNRTGGLGGPDTDGKSTKLLSLSLCFLCAYKMN